MSFDWSNCQVSQINTNPEPGKPSPGKPWANVSQRDEEKLNVLCEASQSRLNNSASILYPARDYSSFMNMVSLMHRLRTARFHAALCFLSLFINGEK